MKIKRANESEIELELPDRGEDGVFVWLTLPTGERVSVMYKAHYGTVDVCTYEPNSDGRLKPKICQATNLVDRFEDGCSSGMHPAQAHAKPHIRMTSQIIINVSAPKE